MAAKTVGFTREAARRIADMVRAAERAPQGGGVPPRGRGGAAFPFGIRKAKTGAGGIAAMSGTTLQSATVTLRKKSGTSLVDDGTVTCWSDFTTAVGANRKITIGFSVVDGVWWVISEDCP